MAQVPEKLPEIKLPEIKLPEKKIEDVLFLNKDGVDPRAKAKKPLSEAKKAQMKQAREASAKKRLERNKVVEEEKKEEKKEQTTNSSFGRTVLAIGLTFVGAFLIGALSGLAQEQMQKVIYENVMVQSKPSKPSESLSREVKKENLEPIAEAESMEDSYCY